MPRSLNMSPEIVDKLKKMGAPARHGRVGEKPEKGDEEAKIQPTDRRERERRVRIPERPEDHKTPRRRLRV